MAVIGRLGLGWSVLQKHLLPRRHQELIGGEQRTFSARLLRPGDLVTCDIRGHHLEAGIPSGAGPERDGYGGANIVSVTLAVARHVDGSVTADCHVGSP